MEQLINTLLANTKMPQPAPAAQKNGSAQTDGFQKLLEQKADAQASSKPEKADAPQKQDPAQDAGKPQETQEPQQAQETQEAREAQQPAAPKSDKELEEQMALAAMAMLQNPVVPVEQAELTPEAQTAVVDEAAPLLAETVLEPERQSIVPEAEAKTTVEVPAEEAEAPASEQAAVTAEELPQAIEAPEAARKTEERTVEVKVETGEVNSRAEETPETEEKPELLDAEAAVPVFEDVEAVPVKVGEAPKSEETAETENIGDQIGVKLAQTAPAAGEGGDQKVTVELSPENLGKVQIEVSLSKDGTLHVTVNAENRSTQNLLNRNSDSLAAILGRYAEKEVRVEVPRQEESQKQNPYDQQQEQHQRRQQQEQRRKQAASGEDFLQQLRLGLIPLDGE